MVIAVGSGMLTVEFVDFLERQVLGLVDKEVHEDEGDETEAAPDPEDVTLQVNVSARGTAIFQIGGDECENEIKEPVRGSGHGHALPADFEGKHFSRDDPSS